MSFHPNGPALERFARGESPSEELSAILRHLLGGCQFCRRRLAPWMELVLAADQIPPGSEAALPRSQTDAYELPVRRALAAAKRQARQVVVEPEELEEALAVARALPESPLGFLQDLRRRLPGLSPAAQIEVFLRLTREERHRDAGRMERYAELAVFSALTLDAGFPGSLRADLQARAHGERANALRIRERFGEARESIDQAFRSHAGGSGDTQLQAELLLIQAALECDERKFSEALGYLHQAKAIYRDLGDRHLEGRVLISEGIYVHVWGFPQEAIRLLRQGLDQLEVSRDPGLEVVARQAFLHALVDCERYREAAQQLLQSGLREAFADQPLNLAKLRWVEGKVLRGLGKLDRAERAFEEVRAAFRESGHPYRAALAGLDLTEIWLQQGKAAPVKELALEVRGVFEKLGIGREACIAVTFLEQVAELAPEPSPEWARHVNRFLQRLEREPQLRFSLPEGALPAFA